VELQRKIVAYDKAIKDLQNALAQVQKYGTESVTEGQQAELVSVAKAFKALADATIGTVGQATPQVKAAYDLAQAVIDGTYAETKLTKAAAGASGTSAVVDGAASALNSSKAGPAADGLGKVVGPAADALQATNKIAEGKYVSASGSLLKLLGGIANLAGEEGPGKAIKGAGDVVSAGKDLYDAGQDFSAARSLASQADYFKLTTEKINAALVDLTAKRQRLLAQQATIQGNGLAGNPTGSKKPATQIGDNGATPALKPKPVSTRKTEDGTESTSGSTSAPSNPKNANSQIVGRVNRPPITYSPSPGVNVAAPGPPPNPFPPSVTSSTQNQSNASQPSVPSSSSSNAANTTGQTGWRWNVPPSSNVSSTNVVDTQNPPPLPPPPPPPPSPSIQDQTINAIDQRLQNWPVHLQQIPENAGSATAPSSTISTPASISGSSGTELTGSGSQSPDESVLPNKTYPDQSAASVPSSRTDWKDMDEAITGPKAQESLQPLLSQEDKQLQQANSARSPVQSSPQINDLVMPGGDQLSRQNDSTSTGGSWRSSVQGTPQMDVISGATSLNGTIPPNPTQQWADAKFPELNGPPTMGSTTLVQPDKYSPDGLMAHNDVKGDLLNTTGGGYFSSTWTVKNGNQVIGSGFSDVQFQGGGRFLAKLKYNGNDGYEIYDASTGKPISSKQFSYVTPLGDGYFGVPTATAGIGMTDIVDPNGNVVVKGAYPSNALIQYTGNGHVAYMINGNTLGVQIPSFQPPRVATQAAPPSPSPNVANNGPSMRSQMATPVSTPQQAPATGGIDLSKKQEYKTNDKLEDEFDKTEQGSEKHNNH
jgi:prefoldin subunit 5